MIFSSILDQIWQQTFQSKIARHLIYGPTTVKQYLSVRSDIWRNYSYFEITKNGAAGYDEIKAVLLKIISSFITEPLEYLSNLSLSEGVFPTELNLQV